MGEMLSSINAFFKDFELILKFIHGIMSIRKSRFQVKDKKKILRKSCTVENTQLQPKVGKRAIFSKKKDITEIM